MSAISGRSSPSTPTGTTASTPCAASGISSWLRPERLRALRPPAPGLFWRIFTLLLAAQVVIAAGAVALTLLVDRALAPAPVNWGSLAQGAGAAYRDGGLAGLRAWQQDRYGDGLVTFLVDDRGLPVDGEMIPPPLAHWVMMTQGNELLRRRGPQGEEAQMPVPGLAGHRLVAFPAMRPADAGTAPRIAAVVVVAIGLIALVTLLLTRSLARPIVELRRVTRSIAAGEYSKRVGSLSRRDEIGALAADFDAMAERVQEQFQAQRQLFRDVSHELKSPLARLQLAIELLREAPDEERARWLPRLDKEAQALAGMLDRILFLAQVDPGAGELRRGAVDLEPLVADLVDDARLEAGQKGQTIGFTADAALCLNGNRMLLGSAVENVIRNAVRYGRPDSAIQVTLAREAGRAVVTVANRGASLRSADLQRIFEPFYRVASPRIGGPPGQGIGLAITRSVVHAHGGTVTAGNHPEGGVIVRMSLPLLATAGDGRAGPRP